MKQERGASAKRTQADHSRRESLTSSSSQEPRATVKLAAMFSSVSQEPGNQLKSSIFKNADPSNLRRSLLEGNTKRTRISSTSCRTGTVIARDDKQNRDTIPMPTFAGRPSTVSSLIPVDFPQTSTVGFQRQQISELQFDKFPNPQSFLIWKIRFKNQVTSYSVFRRKQCYGSKKWRWLTLWKNSSPRDHLLERFSKF